MPRYPKARWRPTPDENDPKIIPVGVILHVDGGNAKSLFNYFNGPSGGIESHLHLNEDLVWEQYHEFTGEADANYRGNSWIGTDGKRYGFISVETQGYANGEWTPGMVRELIEFIRWASKEYGFPTTRAISYRSPGIGYHVMFGSGPGTNSWSNARGKVCPGPARIRQFEYVILPALAGKDEEMNADQQRVLQEVHNMLSALVKTDNRGLEIEARTDLDFEKVHTHLNGIEELISQLKTATSPVGSVTKEDIKSALRELLGSLDD